MQCLQTQQLDPILLSPKFPGVDTCFGAAFCHACNQLCLQEGTGKARTQPRTFRFADSPRNHHWHSQSISESIFHGATQWPSRLCASLQIFLVLVRHKTPSPRHSHHLLQHKLKLTPSVYGCITTPDRVAEHSREPRPLQTVPFL